VRRDGFVVPYDGYLSTVGAEDRTVAGVTLKVGTMGGLDGDLGTNRTLHGLTILFLRRTLHSIITKRTDSLSSTKRVLSKPFDLSVEVVQTFDNLGLELCTWLLAHGTDVVDQNLNVGVIHDPSIPFLG